MAQAGPTITVVVNTLDRPNELAICLAALERDVGAGIRSDEIEILVVDQSRRDASARVCEATSARYVRHRGRGLAASRNHALEQARGDWVAFVDDDGIVRPGWTRILRREVARGDGVAALGGTVVDATTGELQFQNGAVHFDGHHDPIRPLDATLPGPGWSSCAMGTNMAFDRDRLLEIGGFDPFYRYFHEETDAILRLARGGGTLRFVPEWTVDHAFAPSERRRNLADVDYGTIARSLAYFAGRHTDKVGIDRTLHVLRVLSARKAPARLAARRMRKGRLPIHRFLRHEFAIARGTLEALRALSMTHENAKCVS